MDRKVILMAILRDGLDPRQRARFDRGQQGRFGLLQQGTRSQRVPMLQDLET